MHSKYVFELKGEVPRTVMKGEAANITHLCEFGWYILSPVAQQKLG